MHNLILFDEPSLRTALLPFTFTRPVAAIRIGIQTIAEKWGSRLAAEPSYLTESYLRAKFPARYGTDNLYVNGAVCPTPALVARVQALQAEEALTAPDGLLLALRSARSFAQPPTAAEAATVHACVEPMTIIRALPDLFLNNGDQIRADFAFLTAGRPSQPITDPHPRCYAPENIFIEEGAVIRAAVLNAEGGPIYIGRNAVISEGTVMIGPFALCEQATVNWGGKMRNNTTIGPHCKVGGEVGNSIFFGHSNKAHDGFLGNSVIGEWCNLGANTNNSNLKNDYTTVKLHSYGTGQLEDTGRLFCGLMMGDHTKAGISTMFNTGTVIGVNVNVYGPGFQPKFVRSFSWGGAVEGFSVYRLEKAVQVARETVARRGVDFTDEDEAILREVYRREVEAVAPAPTLLIP